MEIALNGSCTDLSCVGLALREYATLNKPQYRHGVSVMECPSDLHSHLALHKTFRKRVNRAKRLGYVVKHVEPRDFHYDLLTINRSAPVRQGRPMDAAYVNLPPTTSAMPEITCPRHHAVVYGVLSPDKVALRAYASIYRCGDLVHVSQFLGHADYLADGIMFALMAAILEEQGREQPSALFYNRHDSGGDGLRWFKERIGLQARDVTWIA